VSSRSPAADDRTGHDIVVAVKTADYLDQLETHGRALADVAGAAGLDADVPTCPGWTMSDLLGHIGQVHRWAASFVRDARTQPPKGDSELTDVPPADELLDWYVAGHAALLQTLRKSPPDVECWTFLPAPSPLKFWVRRQAHETAIHHVDAESSQDGSPTIDTRFAVDGIDELLLGFMSRPRGRLVADPPVSLAVRATDADTDWTIHVDPGSREVTRGVARGDCFVEASASDLYLLLWNRRTADGLKVAGDAKVLDLWRSKATVTWR
jgi:uncharacterized protein (TIGR03083 family)